jgi:RNA polymerase sigma-70 factor (ECF subfamily)
MPAQPVQRDPHALLEHAAWLRRLALSLVGDRAAADDLVQETWVAALRRPPDDARPLRPWLRRVLENAARFRWRGDTNRATREQRAAVAAVASGADATPTSEELLERHQTQQLLARLVSELEEPYRSTILLRYAEGLEPSEIARRQGVPAGTVRWRVKEGLDRLRAMLDDAHAGDRRAWMLALGPLASPRGASAPATGATTTSATTTSTTAWLVLAAVALVAAVLVVLVVGGARERSGARGAVGSARTAAASDERARAPAEDSAYKRLAAIAAGQPPGWIAQEGVAPRRIAGRVVDDGQPAAGVLVRLTSELSLAGLVPALEQRTDALGRFDFGEQVARPYALGAAAPDRLAAIRRFDLRDPRAATDAIELALTPCQAGYHGVVTDAGGSPIAHARLLREDVIGAEAGPDGRYDLCLLPSAAHIDQLNVVVRADGYGAVVLESAPPGRVRRDIVLTPEATIAGRAIDEHGAPVALAEIMLEHDVDSRQPTGEQSATLFAVTDRDGRFRIGGVHVGRHRVDAAARGLAAQRQTVLVAVGATEELTVLMRATARVRGRVVNGGAPISGATVRARGESADAVSQADGSFVLDGVPAGDIAFLAAPYEVETPLAVAITAGAEHEIVLEVAPRARITGTVRRLGVPVPYARVDFNGPTAIGTHADAAGRYELEGLRAGSYGYFADDARRGAFVTGRDVTIAAAEHRVLDLELSGGARVTGVVVDGRGAPVAEVFVRLAGTAGDEGRCVTDAAGGFACAQMRGGATYVPGVFASEHVSVPFAFVGAAPSPVALAAGDARVDGVRLVVDPRTLAIRGRVVDTAGAPISDARVLAWGEGARRTRWTQAPAAVTDVDGGFAFASLAPGAYSLEVAALDGSRSARRVVAAGAADIELVVERPACVDPSGTSRLRHEPEGIASRPPGRVVWGERAERIELLGWHLPATVRRGEPFEMTIYYRTLAPLDRPWAIFVHVDGDRARHLMDHEPLGGTCSTAAWQPGDILVDRVTTTIDPARTPAGRYTVSIGFYTGLAPKWRNFEVSTAPPAMQDSTGRIKIADLIVE